MQMSLLCRRRAFHFPLLVSLMLVSILLTPFLLTPVWDVASAEPAEETSGPPAWGRFDPADLQMTSWPGDPDATAAVLAQTGEVSFTGNFEIVSRNYGRIKIFSEAAYDEWATVKIFYYARSGYQKVGDVEGLTTWLDKDGRMVQTRLEAASIFDEDAANKSSRQVRFTLPALRPGCIIEYRYTTHSRNATFLTSWSFGTSQPTRYSQFVATIPGMLSYRMVRTAINSFTGERREPARWPTDLEGFEVAQRHGINQTRYTWIMKDVPAIRDEPFITTTRDYIPRMQFQLDTFSWPDAMPNEYMKDWNTVARQVEGNLGSCGAANGEVGRLTAGLTDPREKMKAIYSYVRSTMTWDGGSGASDADLCKPFKARKGSYGDIASLLTSMLRKAHLRAFPVLISTRANGKPIDIYPLISQFNRTLTLVEIDGRDYLLDASDPLRPYDVLPFAALNETGFVADPEDPRWVSLPDGVDRSVSVVRAALSPDGAVSGVLVSTENGYAAVKTRRELRDESEKKYVDRVWLPRFRTGILDSARFNAQDSADVPLVTTIHFSGAGTAGDAARRIYFEPVLVKAMDENPFRNPRRFLPVDFGNRMERTYTLTLEVPEGYALETLPEDIDVELPDNGGRLTRRIESSPREIRYVRELVLARPRYSRQEIKTLRSCYERLVTLDNEQIVLLHRPTAAEGGQ